MLLRDSRATSVELFWRWEWKGGRRKSRDAGVMDDGIGEEGLLTKSNRDPRHHRPHRIVNQVRQ